MLGGRRVLAALSAFLLLVVAGCSSGGTGQQTAGTQAVPSDPAKRAAIISAGLQRFPKLQAQAKTGRPASGAPIKLGFVTMTRGNYVYKISLDSAQNAVRFLNGIGGVNGRRLELVSCGTDGSPESAQNCATQMVNSDVLAVGLGVDFHLGVLLKALQSVGASTFGGNPLFTPERTAPNSSFYSTQWAFQLVAAQYAVQQLKAKKVAILSSDTQSGLELARGRAQAALTALGAKSEIFAAPTTATDFSPLASRATGFDAVIGNGGNLMCSGIPLALMNTGYSGPYLSADGCNDKATLDALSGGSTEVYFPTELYAVNAGQAGVPATANAELALYAMASKMGAPNLAIGGHEQIAFQQMVNMAEALAGSGEQRFTRKNVSKILGSSKGANFTAGDYNCDSAALKAAPAFCSLQAGVYRWDGKSMVLKTKGLITPSAVTMGNS